ncbi:hypothetical protein QJ366_004365 [Vibrio vulnificus]|nr:hypothetical protein [Vibrio vulnificus]
MGLVVTAVCGSFCIACLRPLTRRYNLGVLLTPYELYNQEKRLV